MYYRFSDLPADWTAPVGGIQYVTTVGVRWDMGKKNSGWTLKIPAGTVFDLSVPWFGRWYANPHDQRYHLAALLHDLLLEAGYSRAFAASAFDDALAANGISKAKRRVLLAVVISWKWFSNKNQPFKVSD